MTKTETAKRLLKRVFVKEGRWEYYEIDNKRDGEYTSWYKNGRPSVHCNYKDGKRDGEYKRWHSNGQLLEHCYYKNDKLNGEYKNWHNLGKLLVVHCLYKNGEIVKIIK